MRDGRALAFVVALLLAYVLNPATGPWARSVVKSAGQMYRYRHAAPESRAASLLGDAWLLIDEARRVTPEHAVILIPDGPGADPVSNRVWCAYYLHPRRLVRSGEVGADSLDYVLVYRGYNRDHVGTAGVAIPTDGSAVVPVGAR